MQTLERETLQVSIVIPCLNEAKTLGTVIDRARLALDTYGYRGEVVVADNGSTDGSQQIAATHGARVVPVAERGYGSALLGGIRAARGEFVVMGDADDTYDFMEIDRFVEHWRSGHEFVMGTRLRGAIEAGAMPPLHRYLGTPVLTFLINLFFGTRLSDCNSGIRGFTRAAFERMQLHSTGMEFASEMLIKAGLLGLATTEVPVSLRVDRRERPPHLRTWRDGWRHLRFILTYGADRLFLIPGIAMVLVGLIGFALLVGGPVRLGGLFMDFHFLFPSALLVICGTQLIVLTSLVDAYTGLARYKPLAKTFRRLLTFENGLVAGALLFAAGLAVNLTIVAAWLDHLGSGLFAVRPAILAMTLMAVGVQVFFSAFLVGVLQIPRRES